jgi:hypothetical protein
MEVWKTRPDSAYFLRRAAFHFAQRARWAAAIRLRAAADMVLRFRRDARARPCLMVVAPGAPTPLSASKLRPVVRLRVMLDSVPSLTAGLHEPSWTLILSGRNCSSLALRRPFYVPDYRQPTTDSFQPSRGVP